MNLIPIRYPLLTPTELANIDKFLRNKCSEFYFLDFLDTTSGNIPDAKELFKLDERLRGILLRYLLRFEIQIKNDFVTFVEASTGSSSFWNDVTYYYPTFVSIKKGAFKSDFDFMKSKVYESLKNLNMNVTGAPDYEAFYAISFGTFIRIFKSIQTKYKTTFFNSYTSYLPVHDFKTLHSYLLSIRLIRNRCAHGNHLVTNSLVNQLNQFSWITNPSRTSKPSVQYSEFELTLYFVLHNLRCWREMRKELHSLFVKFEPIYSKYGGKQSINPKICSKLFNNHFSSISK